MISKFYSWCSNLPSRAKTSALVAVSLFSGVSAVATVLGISLGDVQGLDIPKRALIVAIAFAAIAGITYCAIGVIFKNSVNLIIGGAKITLRQGDLFDTTALRVIGCDTHFDTRIDDVVISRKSLHGQFIANHCDTKALEAAVEAEALRQGLAKDRNGLYNFPLGSIVKYHNENEGCTYLLVATTKLDPDYKARTNMAEYEQMLMNMWTEIDRVYAQSDIALPVLGDGTVRFQDGPQGKTNLLRCMLCTLNSSGVTLKSRVEIVIYDDIEDVPLYEFRNLFHTPTRR